MFRVIKCSSKKRDNLICPHCCSKKTKIKRFILVSILKPGFLYSSVHLKHLRIKKLSLLAHPRVSDAEV